MIAESDRSKVDSLFRFAVGDVLKLKIDDVKRSFKLNVLARKIHDGMEGIEKSYTCRVLGETLSHSGVDFLEHELEIWQDDPNLKILEREIPVLMAEIEKFKKQVQRSIQPGGDQVNDALDLKQHKFDPIPIADGKMERFSVAFAGPVVLNELQLTKGFLIAKVMIGREEYYEGTHTGMYVAPNVTVVAYVMGVVKEGVPQGSRPTPRCVAQWLYEEYKENEEDLAPQRAEFAPTPIPKTPLEAARAAHPGQAGSPFTQVVTATSTSHVTPSRHTPLAHSPVGARALVTSRSTLTHILEAVRTGYATTPHNTPEIVHRLRQAAPANGQRPGLNEIRVDLEPDEIQAVLRLLEMGQKTEEQHLLAAQAKIVLALEAP